MKDGLFENKEKYKKEIDNALKNTLEIADKIEEIEVELGKIDFPEFEDIPEGYTPKKYLRGGCNYLLKQLNKKEDINYEKYKTRLNTELNIISNKGYDTYFLIVADFIKWAEKNNILVGCGRGSAGGSLVSYLLGITKIDPIKYGLLFSRFLNPERDSMPDIDIDLPQSGREKVIDYVIEKYGEDKVSQICTFGTMSTKAVLKDVGRVMDFDFHYMNSQVVKAVPKQSEGLKEDLKNSKKLNFFSKKHPQLFKYAKQLEDKPRNLGTHAAAVVITPKPVTEYTPLANSKGDLITQVEMNDAEELGMLKMDFLGLKTLDIIQNTIEFISKRNDLDNFDFIPTMDNIWQTPLGDKEVYKNIYAEGNTNGVFQTESQLFKKLLKEMEPDNFEDIIAVLALGRPSVLDAGLDKQFIKRKLGKEEVEYPHEDLKDILKDTYGIMLYQEQVLKVAQKVGGFSLGKADILRRAIGKFFAH